MLDVLACHGSERFFYRMDQILIYEDSESSSHSDLFVEEKSECINESYLLQSESLKSYEPVHQTEIQNSNFFGLDSSDEDETNYNASLEPLHKHDETKYDDQLPSLHCHLINNALKLFPTRFEDEKKQLKRKSSQDIVTPPKIKPYKSKSSQLTLNIKSDDQSSSDCPQYTDILKIHPKINDHLNKLPNSYIPKTKLWEKQAGKGMITSMCWNISQYSHLLLIACIDKTVTLWDIFKKDRVLSLSGNKEYIKTAVWNNDASSIATGGYDKVLRLYDSSSAICTFEKPFDDCLSSLKFHSTETNLLMIGSKNIVQCWDVRANEIVRDFTYRTEFDQVEDIVFLNNGNEVACCTNHISRESADRSIIVWDFRLGSLESNQVYQERYTCTCLRVHPIESVFMAQTNGNYIALFSSIRPFKMNKYKRFEGHKMSGYKITCDISPDGHQVVSGSSEGLMHFYNYKTGNLMKNISAYSEPCTHVRYHPVIPGMLASTDFSGNLSLWQ